MTGGYFNYEQHRLDTLAIMIQKAIDDREYSEETKDTLHKTIVKLEETLIYLEKIDELLSGDISEQKFHNDLKFELNKFYISGEW